MSGHAHQGNRPQSHRHNEMDDRVQTPVAGQQVLAEIRRSDESHTLRWASRGVSRRYGLPLRPKSGSVVLSGLVIM